MLTKTLSPDRELGNYEARYWSVIYLCEDASGEIIYVGQTGQFWDRRTAHIRTSPWWREVKAIHVIDCTRCSAATRRRDETILIKGSPAQAQQGWDRT
jgi:hypothetical protein